MEIRDRRSRFVGCASASRAEARKIPEEFICAGSGASKLQIDNRTVAPGEGRGEICDFGSH